MNSPAVLLPLFDKLISLLVQAVDPFTIAECALALVMVVLALTAPSAGSRIFEKLEAGVSSLAHHPVRQIMAVGAFAFLCRASILPWLGTPVPFAFDEHSLMLQAQTFLQGRLANPTHPFWQHFETYYINQIPAYGSMYFPGRGAPLLAGLLVAHNAWVGVWISVVLMCMAATWMLQGWVSMPMAFLGGLLVTIRLGIFSFWTNSYYGGAFTALGAMLVLGALARIWREPGWRQGLVMGAGMAILMLSRPYEGALLCLPIALALLLHLTKPKWKIAGPAIAKLAIPISLMVAASGGFLLVYNAATTGNPLKTAYSLQRETYADAPAFLIAAPIASQKRGPAYFRSYYAVEASAYQNRHSPFQLLRGVLAKLLHTWNFYIGATFSIAFAAGLWAGRRDYLLWGTMAFFLAGYFLETWNFPQYTAPIYPVLLVFTMRGFEYLRAQDAVLRPAGLFLARAMPTAAVALLALPVASLVFGLPSLTSSPLNGSCCAIRNDELRPALMRQLLASPGSDLVFVRDGPQNPVNYELVFNEADIDKAQVVWAHRLSPEKDRRLQAYFHDRKVWEFEWLADTPRAKGSRPGYRFRQIGP